MSDNHFEPVSGVDSAWLRLDRPTNLMVITAMAVVEPIPFNKLKELINSRFLAFPRFRQKPVNHSGFYFWEEDPYFSLDYHVRKVALPQPADKGALEKFIGDLMSTPLDPGKPLWQVYLIENYGDHHVCVMRVHHCYADGLALVAVFGSLSDQSPNINPFPLDPGKQRDAGVRARQSFVMGMETLSRAVEKCTKLRYRIAEEGKSILREPGYAVEGVRQGLNGAAEIARLAALEADDTTPLRGELGVMKCCTWSELIPLHKFKEVAQAFGCSINDVLLSCVSGGLRRLLQDRMDQVDGVRLHATLPVNLRPLETRLGREQLQELGNQFGTVFVPLAAGIGNPIERLYKIKHDMAALKESMQPSLSHALLTAMGLFPQGVQQPLLELFSNKTSMVLSNVPGARRARYLAGSKVKELMFWVPQTGDIGLGVSLLSYNQSVQIGINADRALLPEPAELTRAMIDSLEEYCSLTGMTWQAAEARSHRKA
ncbi:wax ester/triacylglycerol synthase family O-acyltransferase [Hahella sp. HN01]|uniref:WS/DGAT/MGAT family O-acyltransferase n=1 Tax=Hahella sp. HN01 TaxID=2847262 RepID=UPI001C1EBF15|nr:wax ester/triacylglycerol synthase family O-acyltransferase [Hahella sp. HN01]MBU6953149.1 wax ester/triacylglycerol synthase family O-acyltransferase [Hahella sp. HN01]